VDPRNGVLNVGPDPSAVMGKFWEKWNGGECGNGHAKTAEPTELLFGALSEVSPGNHVSDGRAGCTLVPPDKYGLTIVRGYAAVSGFATSSGDAACSQTTWGNLDIMKLTLVSYRGLPRCTQLAASCHSRVLIYSRLW